MDYDKMIRDFEMEQKLAVEQMKIERARREYHREQVARQKKDLLITLVSVVGVVLIMALLLFHWFSYDGGWSKVDWEIDTYVVERGDTLWSIGGSLTDDLVDLRIWCDKVEDLNGIGSTIHERDVIKVYVPKTED